ncbi:Tenascin [Channa argus]|uniref:Tenascin n=1 Tax=Channa argus TaxID=215402 RepID=A0A6G1QWR0_CHAAH|nr:Tenascin [Channa argus]
MFPLTLSLILLLPALSIQTPSTSRELQVGGHRSPRDTKQDTIKVVISEGCANQADSADSSQGGKEIDLVPGSPLVLTHKIKLVPSSSGSGSGSCGWEADFATLRERLERLEREVSVLREKCGGAEGGCCTSKESKGAGCIIKPGNECPNECSDQGRCMDGKCVCFHGFSGADCSESSCPGNCNNNGRCVKGQCVCDPGFSGSDCSERSCPDNCSSQGRCVNGRCVCNSGFTGPSCSSESCPANCNNRGQCVSGQCVCNPGFSGSDCSQRTCPNNCADHGRCVNGNCVCDSGFTGADCSEISCPGNCNNRGRCVSGKCVCNPGFAGTVCSEKACPNNCNNRGRCVNGKCVCDSGFTGADCSEISCPGNCNGRGSCVNGQCVCNPGFKGTDCSEKVCAHDCNNHGRCVNGKCVCDSGFTGVDCSNIACPGNCNKRGRCVNGQCVCNPGFTGTDCSEKACPHDCDNRGRCVNGKCVCDSGFTGADCSQVACPGNCKKRGRCINGQCVCAEGFTGADCSEKACPNNCSNQGKCVKGTCVCNGGFAGPDCAAKACPNNCSNRGQCMNGRCVCQRGFTGQDCSLCEEGMTGPNCDTAMSGVSQLSTQNITETSVTLVWTPPSVQYDRYRLTFTSQKEHDQQVTMQVEGSLTTFTQTGLAAGQEYTVTITGELDGRKGAESSTEFMTLIPGPTNLKVVKTTSTSAVVQWEKSQGEIDRYHLTVTPSDAAGKSQEMTIPMGQDSAHILQLEAGHLYDIVLVAEKGTSRSRPVTTQAVPGKTLPSVTTAALTMQVTQAPGQEVGDSEQEFNPSLEVQVPEKGRREGGSEADPVKVRGIDGSNEYSSITQPLFSRTMAKNGTKPKVFQRLRKPNVPGPFRFNATRVVPGGRKVGPGALKKPLLGWDKKISIVPKKLKPAVPKIGHRRVSLNVSDPSFKASSSERRDDKNPTLMSETDSETNSPSSLREMKEQTDVGVSGQGNETAPVSSEPTGTAQRQEKKCLNKIKVTHVRLPLKDRGSGCGGDGAMAVGKILGSDEVSPEVDGTRSSVKSDTEYSSDPLHKLLTDTFDNLNITTFSVHLSEPSNLSADVETARKQILSRLKPVSSSSSSSSSSQSLLFQSSAAASSSLTYQPSITESSSSASSSPMLSLSTMAPSSQNTYLTSSSSPVPAPLPSLSPSSSSNSDESDSVGLNKLDADNSISTTTVTPSKDKKRLPSKHGELLRHAFPKHGYSRYPPRSFPNKTLNLGIRDRASVGLNLNPRQKTENNRTTTKQFSSSPSSSNSEVSPSVELKTPVKNVREHGLSTTVFSRDDQNQNKMPAGRRWIPGTLKTGHLHRPFLNIRNNQNRTRPNVRFMTRPSQPKTVTQKEQMSPTQLPATLSAPVSKESFLSKGAELGGEVKGDFVGKRMSITSMPNEMSNQTLTGIGGPSSIRPTTKVGYSHRVQPIGPLTNKTRQIIRLSEHPYRGRKPLPTRKINGGSRIAVVSQSVPKLPAEEDVPRPTQVVTISRVEKETGKVEPHRKINGPNTLIRQTNELEQGSNVLIQTTQFEEEISNPNTNLESDKKKEAADGGKNNGGTSRGSPTIRQSFSRPVPLTKKKIQPKNRIAHYISGSKRGEHPKTNHTAGRLLDRKTAQTGIAASKPVMPPDVSSVGVTREPLDYVGVANRSSDGFTLMWDSPEGKYKSFVVTTKEVGKTEEPKPKAVRVDQSEPIDFEKDGGNEEDSTESIKEADNTVSEAENRLTESVITQIPKNKSSTTVKHATQSDKGLIKVLPGSTRSFQFEDLFPQTEYTVTLLGMGPGLLSRLHKLVISTGPEPPTNIVFSKVTENSLTVSWTKPKSPVSGFKVTYTHTEDGEPMSVSVDSEQSAFTLSQLLPGSSYEVSIISTLGLDESDPVKDLVMTLPDPPTDLRAINITDTKALLLWRPALAAVDKYTIVYGSGTGSELRVSVSGNAAEQQLSGLEGSTTYTVTVTSQLDSLESPPTTTSFTTTSGSGGDGDGPGDLQVKNVTPRTALLSWKPSSNPAGSYRLTYQTEGQEMKEVIVDPSVSEYNLTRLHPGSKYLAQLQTEEGGRYISGASAEFTTRTLRFPFPADCSEELQNGMRTSGEVEIFPQGKLGQTIVVYCDMETDGGGWTVFQRRMDGSVNFFRGWNDYVNGFGNPSGDFWLGLEGLHNLTAMNRMTLRVDLRDGDESVFAKYSTFDVSKKNYKLTVGGYSGNAGDSLSYHNNQIFSTRDRDRTQFITRCAMSYRGGWWYKNCHEANLNGLYGINVKHQGVIWTTWKGKKFSIPFTEMKMRPAAFSPPARG